MPAPLRTSAPRHWRVAAVQMEFGRTIAENLAKIAQAVARAADGKADVVLFPECAVTGYGHDFSWLKPSQLREPLYAVGDIAAHHDVNVLVGSPVFRSHRWQNCLLVFDRRG